MAPKKKSLKRRMESGDSDDEPVPPLYDSDGELHPEDAPRGARAQPERRRELKSGRGGRAPAAVVSASGSSSQPLVTATPLVAPGRRSLRARMAAVSEDEVESSEDEAVALHHGKPQPFIRFLREK